MSLWKRKALKYFIQPMWWFCYVVKILDWGEKFKYKGEVTFTILRIFADEIQSFQ